MGIILVLKVYMNKDMRSIEERILDAGYDGITYLVNESY